MLTARVDLPESDERPASERLAALRASRARQGSRHPVRAAGVSSAPPESAAEVTSPLPVIEPEGGGPFSSLLDRWVPASWRGARLDPGRPGAIALIVVAALAAIAAAIGVWRDRPLAEPAPPLAVTASPSGLTPSSGTPTPPGAVPGQQLVVSVAGKVRRPGLARLPDGARVADAITAAGGPLPGTDLTMLNLARRLADGEQILVGLPQPPEAALVGPGAPAGPGPASDPATGPRGKIDLNRATLEQLDTLPGIGPVTAQRILDWRTQHGRFTAVEQLREVDGIGERRFSQLREQVSV